ncbi:hypothetical protein [Cecembia rubra]|uniref:Uncharacterized protein n=1 Tax=Cecembia rubra TaxID=1485585 RepID=A0A2P8E4M3_9BACT|nr:hypothetical protein [Cecembia rubra]PSL04416.1 hypothetical protein CLV48_105160 [Cecembia rubra]
MPENLRKIHELLEEIQSIRTNYLVESSPEISRHLGRSGEDEQRPDIFNPTSFLFIRSFVGDAGNRPISGFTFWNSPDINILPLEAGTSYTTTLEAGKSYSIRCQLHNSGDLMIPYPKVEFFLCDPSLGFNTAFAIQLGLVQMDGILLAGGQGSVELKYQVPISESGHKCLFARTFSFSPLDKPDNLHILDPRHQRHVAQKNLNFVSQSSNYSFQLVHFPNTEAEIHFRTLSQFEIYEMRHPFISDFRVKGRTNQGIFRKIFLEAKKSSHDLQMNWARSGIRIITRGDGPDIQVQQQVLRSFEESLISINNGRGNRSLHQKLAKTYEELGKNMVKTNFDFKIPDFGLEKGEATGLEISAINLTNGHLIGGITLIVTG